MQIRIIGDASSKTLLEFNSSELEGNLLDYLRDKELPIASSCNGDGICAKCDLFIKGESYLSCQLKIESLREASSNRNHLDIHINYL